MNLKKTASLFIIVLILNQFLMYTSFFLYTQKNKIMDIILELHSIVGLCGCSQFYFHHRWVPHNIIPQNRYTNQHSMYFTC